jgi:hypothetical protein
MDYERIWTMKQITGRITESLFKSLLKVLISQERTEDDDKNIFNA